LDVENPSGKVVEMEATCGVTNWLQRSDFVQLNPGESLLLFRSGSEFTDEFGKEVLDPKTFSLPGKYKIRFTYSTDSSEFESWVGNGVLDAKALRLIKEGTESKLFGWWDPYLQELVKQVSKGFITSELHLTIHK
jgi:hypothetical protein